MAENFQIFAAVKAGEKYDRQCENEKLPAPWQNKGNDVYHGRQEWIIGQNMPFVPQPSRSCGMLGSTNHTQATFWNKFCCSSSSIFVSIV